MNCKRLGFTILIILFCLSLISCKSQGYQIQGDPSDLVPRPEIREDAVVEIGSIDPEIDQQFCIVR